MAVDFVRKAQEEIAEGGGNLFHVLPGTVRVILETEAWRCESASGEEFKTFYEFVEAKLWHGLEVKYSDLQLWCKNNAEVTVMLKDELPLGREDGDRRCDNITPPSLPARGTDPTYTLRRLKRDRPDLADKVVKGDLSANAAAIEAGFRKKMATVPLEIDRFVAKALKHWSSDELIDAIMKQTEASSA